jgi:hypothetical protein
VLPLLQDLAATSLNPYKGRKPTARAKAADAVKLFRDGKRVSDVAKVQRAFTALWRMLASGRERARGN